MQLRYITAKGVSADASQQMYTVHTVTVLVLYPASRKKKKKKERTQPDSMSYV